MAKRQELQTKLGKLAATIKQKADEFNAADFEPTAEWQSNLDQATADYDAAAAELASLDKMEAIAKQERERQDPRRQSLGRDMPKGGEVQSELAEGLERQSRAMEGWFASGTPTPEQQEAMEAQGIGRDAEAAEFQLFASRPFKALQHAYQSAHPTLFESQAQTALSGVLGGFTIPSTLIPTLEVAMLEYGNIVGICDVIRTDGGGPLHFSTQDDTANEGALIGEEEEDTEDEVGFGRFTLGAFEATSRIIPISRTLVEDSGIDVAAEIGNRLGERLGKLMSRKICVGNGAGEPLGVVNSAIAATPDGTGQGPGDDLIALIHACPRAHRRNGRFVLTDNALKNIRLIKNQDGDYIWRPGLSEGRPDSLLGYGYEVSDHVPEGVEGLETILFGDFSKMKVRVCRGLTIDRDYSIQRRMYLLVATMRFDAGLLDAGQGPIRKMDIQFDFTGVS